MTGPPEFVQIVTDSGPARAHLWTPGVTAPVGLLVLGPGAGGQIATPDLHAVREVAVADGWTVALVEPPYRVAGRRLPPRGAGPDLAFTTVVAQLRDRLPDGTALVTGGRSFGSRVACRTARATGAAAVLCLAFPLHPPNNPERTRAGELQPVPVPVLVVQGERDPFGRPAAGPDREVAVVPGDHGLKQDLPTVVRVVREFLRRHGRQQAAAAALPALPFPHG